MLANRSFRLPRLTTASLPAIVALQREVSAGLPPGFIRDKNERDLMAYLDGTLGCAFGIFEQGVMTAMALLRIPSPDHPNQGMPFPKVPAPDWPLRAAFLENTMVAPRARGRGHQRKLLDARLAFAASTGVRWVCAGVHLANVASWRNLFAKGMVIAGLRMDTGHPVIGLLRALGETPLRSNPADRRALLAHDFAAHRDALQDGYIGVRMTRHNAVVYQRHAQATE